MRSPAVLAERILGGVARIPRAGPAPARSVPPTDAPASPAPGPSAKEVGSVRAVGRSLEVTWNDGRSYAFPLIWLRDNCDCPRCLHPHTRERTFDLLTVPETPRVASAGLAGRGAVMVLWGDDGHTSKYEPDWLRRYAFESSDDDLTRPDVVLWDASLSGHVPRFDYRAVMESEQGLEAWLSALLGHGVAVVADTPCRDREVVRVTERIAYARRSNFGEHFEVQTETNPINNAYTALKLPNHTDLCNWERSPGYQFLHCLENAATGGESTLVDGFRIAEALRRADAGAFRVLSTMPVLFRFHDTECDLRFHAPIVGLDGSGRFERIRFNFGLFGVQALPPDETAALYAAYRKFAQLVRDDRYQIRFRLRPGDLLTFDNWRVLHGRLAYQPSTGKRHLQGCYVDRDEVLSRLRMSISAVTDAA